MSGWPRSVDRILLSTPTSAIASAIVFIGVKPQRWVVETKQSSKLTPPIAGELLLQFDGEVDGLPLRVRDQQMFDAAFPGMAGQKTAFLRAQVARSTARPRTVMWARADPGPDWMAPQVPQVRVPENK